MTTQNKKPLPALTPLTLLNVPFTVVDPRELPPFAEGF